MSTLRMNQTTLLDIEYKTWLDQTNLSSYRVLKDNSKDEYPYHYISVQWTKQGLTEAHLGEDRGLGRTGEEVSTTVIRITFISTGLQIGQHSYNIFKYNQKTWKHHITHSCWDEGFKTSLISKLHLSRKCNIYLWRTNWNAKLNYLH